jgi:hypothetical protein
MVLPLGASVAGVSSETTAPPSAGTAVTDSALLLPLTAKMLLLETLLSVYDEVLK